MLSQITKRSIHEEAKYLIFNLINHIKARRFEYLGHKLRLDNDHTLRKVCEQQRPLFRNSSTRSGELEL